MKTLKTFAMLALAFFATPAFAADPPSQVGRLNHISGAVSFAPAEASNDWTAALLNRPITTGDRLWADTGGRAEIHVGSTAIRLSEQTSLHVLNIDDRGIQLGLGQGSVNVRLRRLSADEVFEVDTPRGAVILDQPGSYRISVDPSGVATTVSVYSGRAEVLTSELRFPVRADQQARIAGTDPVSYDIASTPPLDEFDRWAAARDRREDRVASTRYVSPYMTGYEDLDDYGAWRTVPEYGSVWVPSGVPVGWAPYRHGHWVWVSPWGWTWVDSMPWGFAPFHYGRWIWVGSYWAWAPGPVAVRPVYAPALVAFIGGSDFSVSIGIGSAPVVAWVPLGWREPYIPWYRVTPTYVRNVNIAHVHNINVTNIHSITNQYTRVTNVRYANRRAPSGVTVTRRDVFASAKPVEHVRAPPQALSAAPVMSAAPVGTPDRTSFAPSRSGPRPPRAATSREVFAATPPPAAARDARTRTDKGDRAPAGVTQDERRPRVRVISPRDRVQGVPSPVDAQRPPQQTERAKGRERDEKSPQPQARPQQERKARAQPPDVSKRPMVDRDVRKPAPPPSAPPAARAPRPPPPAKPEGTRNRARADAPPRAQPRPQQKPGVQKPPPAQRPAPSAPPPQARDVKENDDRARPEERPAQKAGPRRE